jgi:hypothetical protein
VEGLTVVAFRELGTMDELQVLGERSRGSLIRMVRIGVGLFGTGFATGVVVALVFHALIVTLVVVAALVIVAITAAKVMIGRRRY